MTYLRSIVLLASLVAPINSASEVLPPKIDGQWTSFCTVLYCLAASRSGAPDKAFSISLREQDALYAGFVKQSQVKNPSGALSVIVDGREIVAGECRTRILSGMLTCEMFESVDAAVEALRRGSTASVTLEIDGFVETWDLDLVGAEQAVARIYNALGREFLPLTKDEL